LESNENEIKNNLDEIEEDVNIPMAEEVENIEIKPDNTQPKIFDSYDDMIRRLKDDVKNLKKIKKQQKKIIKLEEKRKEVLNDIERKREIEMKLKERSRKKHRKH
jgi:hypothetical protein